MESFLYFLFWAALIFVMLRFGCGAHVTGHRRRHGEPKQEDRAHLPGGNARWPSPERARDPVCGVSVDGAQAKSSVHAGHVYYFCSPSCRDKFEASPATYAMKGASRQTATMEYSHEHHH